MFFLYNFLQVLFLPLLLPPLALVALGRAKYRDRLPARLGWGLRRSIPPRRGNAKSFWVHALSVGEITSAVPLVQGLRQAYPEARIMVSVTTRTGRGVADILLAGLADRVIDAPLDLLPVVRHYLKILQPDLFILVETDFWPNMLHQLRHSGVPTVLVNGRISASSQAAYRRFACIARPMFQSFTALCMQTDKGRAEMLAIGVEPQRVHSPGNLKYASRPSRHGEQHLRPLLPAARLLWLAGSTHHGEEELLFTAYQAARRDRPELFLLVAPRDPSRTGELLRLAERYGWHADRRSDPRREPADLMIIDSIGELVDFYALADIAFVGGSLVARGGHNPLEPAASGIPVLFGPHMEDFAEIAADLIAAGGATEVTDGEELARQITLLAASPETRIRQGQAALRCVQRLEGVVDRHLALFRDLL